MRNITKINSEKNLSCIYSTASSNWILSSETKTFKDIIFQLLMLSPVLENKELLFGKHNNPFLMRQRNNAFRLTLQTRKGISSKGKLTICISSELGICYSFSLRYITNIFIILLRIIFSCLLIFVDSFIELLGAQTMIVLLDHL